VQTSAKHIDSTQQQHNPGFEPIAYLEFRTPIAFCASLTQHFFSKHPAVPKPHFCKSKWSRIQDSFRITPKI